MYLLFTVIPVCIYNGKPSSSLLSSGYVDDAFVVNVTTVTSETVFSCASGFVMYFTTDKKIELCLCNVTKLRPKHSDFCFYKNYAELCVIPTFVFLNRNAHVSYDSMTKLSGTLKF